MENDFKSLGLKDALIDGLIKSGIIKPTEIQEKIIPLALMNKDVIGQSETGTGKTLAFLLPIVERLDPTSKELQAIILTPTHELAMQIYKVCQDFAENSGIPFRTASIIGDVNITRQIEKLKEKPHIIVGSPLRILELIKKGKIHAHTTKTIIVDEADKMLHRNNVESVKAVIKTTLRDRQLMMFSATFTEDAVKIAQEIMKEPEIVTIEDNLVNSNISHYYIACDYRDKILTLRKLISALNPKKAIIFINRSGEIDVIASKLKYHNLKVTSIHGSNEKEDRARAMEEIRSGKSELLVSSDLSARGMDIKGVTHIFNLDIPEDPEDYLHRTGRTGRAGKTGVAVSIITESQTSQIKKFERALNIEIAETQLYMGKMLKCQPSDK